MASTVTLAIQCEHIEVTRGTHRSIKLEIDEIRSKRKNNAYGWSEKSICGDDDDKEHKRGRMLAAGSRQGMTDLPLFHPECGGSRPTGFPSALQISARQREGKSNNAD